MGGGIIMDDFDIKYSFLKWDNWRRIGLVLYNVCFLKGVWVVWKWRRLLKK